MGKKSVYFLTSPRIYFGEFKLIIKCSYANECFGHIKQSEISHCISTF